MEELLDYLQCYDSLPFSTTELSEALLMAYTFIKSTVRDQCTVIEVSSEQVTRKKEIGGETVHEFSTPVDFRPYFSLIIRRDPMIQAHLQLVEETDDIVRYRLV